MSSNYDDIFAMMNTIKRNEKQQKVEDDNKCRDCGNIILFDSSKSINICVKCGLEDNIVLNKTGEYNYSDANNTSRNNNISSNPLLQNNSSLKLSGNKCSYQLQSAHNSNSPTKYNEKCLSKDFETISIKCQNNIPKAVLDEAFLICKIVKDSNKIFRRKNKNASLGACVYCACKQAKVQRSKIEIAELFTTDKTSLTDCYNIILEILINNKNFKVTNIIENPSVPNDFISRFCSNIRQLDESILTTEIENEIKQIVSVIYDKKLIKSNTPPSLVAGCIYYVAMKHNIKLSKKMVKDSCKISEVTITKCYNTIINPENNIEQHILKYINI
jgi:transcription initiation factor TFIIB